MFIFSIIQNNIIQSEHLLVFNEVLMKTKQTVPIHRDSLFLYYADSDYGIIVFNTVCPFAFEAFTIQKPGFN